MAEKEGLDLESYIGPVRAALDPDERKFFKAYLGEEGPGLMDFLHPTGRFKQARELRERIVSKVLNQAIDESQNPTLEEAQGMFPNFPIPARARETRPIQMTMPGQPVQTGVETITSPPIQGPGAPVLKPLPENVGPNRDFMSGYVSAPGGLGTPEQLGQAQRTANRLYPTHEIVEGPRPQSPTHEVGIYADEVVPALETRVNPHSRLRNSEVNLLKQLQHKEGLKGSVPRTGLTEAELKATHQARYEKIKAGGPEAYPGEAGVLENFLGLYEKDARPGSDKALEQKGKAKKAVAEGEHADRKEQAQIGELDARADHERSQAETNYRLLDAKLRNLESEIALRETQRSQIGQKAAMAEERIALEAAKAELKTVLGLVNRGILDDASASKAFVDIYNRFSTGGETKMQQREPTWAEKYIPGMGGPAVEIVPKGSTPVAPGSVAPGSKPDVAPPATQPDSPEADMAGLKLMGQSMKEGEVKEYKGVKYKKVGKRLEQVR
jgi:hypothetical protein